MSKKKKRWFLVPYHCHEGAPHLVDPDVAAIASEAVDHDLGRKAAVEATLGPRKSVAQVSKGNFGRWGATSSPVMAGVHEEFGVNFVRSGGQHVQIAERAGCFEATELWITNALRVPFPTAATKVGIENISWICIGIYLSTCHVSP